MIWDAIAAIGQAFSALALFFLLVQVRHARTDMRRSVLDSMASAINTSVPLGCDARILSASAKANKALGAEPGPFVKALMEQTGLTEEEALLVNSQCVTQWYAVVPTIRCRDSLTPGDRISLELNLRRVFGTSPVGRLWYEKRAKAGMNPDDRPYLDKVLAETG
jgi:hypothetical protein